MVNKTGGTSMMRRLVIPSLILAMGLWPACGREASTAESESEKPGFLASWFGPKTIHVTVPAGTIYTVALEHGLSSESNAAGDPVRARVVGNILSDGKLVVADGAQVRGVVSEAEGSGRVKGRARLAIRMTSIETVDGVKEIESTMVAGALVAPGTKKRDAATIAGGAAAGAVLGEIIGDEAAKGAVIGGAAGTGVVLATKGKEVAVSAGKQLKFKTQSTLEADVPMVAKAD
jgi:hypothetical protein